jgi:hypothetical protein
VKNELKDILSLIAATVFADKHVYASEIDEFMKSTSKLDVVQSLEPKMSEAKLLAWYEMNKDDIRGNLSTPYFKDWFYGILDRLKDIPNKDSIIETMHRISRADGSIHVSERALITLAERHWRLR